MARTSSRARSSSRPRTITVSAVARDIANAFVRHNLLTYAAAVSFQAIVALIPLFVLALAVLGALGLGHVWADSLAPAIQGRVTAPVFHGIDFSARRIVSTGNAVTIAVAGLLSAWYLTAAVRVVIEALNKIHDVDDDRPWLRRALVELGLAVLVGAVLITSFVIVSIAGGTGFDAVLLGAGRWLAAIVLLGFAIGMLVRFGPSEHPQPRWASAGSLLVVASWIVASIAFRWWIEDVVDFKSSAGSLLGLLALAGYLFTSVGVFLVGVQLDETLRNETGGSARDLLPSFMPFSGPG